VTVFLILDGNASKEERQRTIDNGNQSDFIIEYHTLLIFLRTSIQYDLCWSNDL